MENFKFSLTKKGKGICPACGRKSFVLYINNYTGEPLHSAVGKCDRADNCGHHYAPKQYFTDNNISFDSKTSVSPRSNTGNRSETPQPQPSFIDTELFKKTLTAYNENRLIQYLSSIVGDELAKEATNRYYIGTSKHWDGATVFWQIDRLGRVRCGKIMQYDDRTGKRIKEPVNKISWVHAVLKLQSFNLSQCLFGEHLLSDDTKIAAIVESEKTAIIASCYLPDFIWLACGGCNNLSVKLCEPLKGRNVILFPDAGRYDEWTEKAKMLSAICNVSVSSLIEEKATDEERESGFDLADYLVRFSPSEFARNRQPDTQPEPNIQHAAYVADAGELFIPTPPDNKTTYTVYPSVEAYNKRAGLPAFVPFHSVDTSGMNKVSINIKTLRV